MGMELEGTSGRPLMLKEWLELESTAELSGDGFGCYPRYLAAELRSASGRRRRNGGDVIARVSAAVRSALFFSPPALGRGRGRQGEAAAAAALSRSTSLSRRLRVGFWKKRGGEAVETADSLVASCSAAAGIGKWASSSPAMSPQRMSWDEAARHAGGDAAGLDDRRSHQETERAGCECDRTCRLREEPEQEEDRLSPVSVMDFLSQDEADDGNDDSGGSGNGNGHGEGDGDDEITSPAFERSLANMRRASQLLLQKIRRFEQLAELDPSDVDTATTATEDTSCHMVESDSSEDDADDGAVQDLLGQLLVSYPVAACRFQKVLEDFFRGGMWPSRYGEGSDGPEAKKLLLLQGAKAWLNGQHCPLRSDDGRAEVEEIERLGRWRCFREDEQELLVFDMECGIFWSLMAELVDELC
ncbi:hypothetical protein ACP4OV_011357 [Aristida adscensionis]